MMKIINPNNKSFDIPPEYTALFKKAILGKTISKVITDKEQAINFKPMFYFVEQEAFSDGKILIELKKIQVYEL